MENTNWYFKLDYTFSFASIYEPSVIREVTAKHTKIPIAGIANTNKNVP